MKAVFVLKPKLWLGWSAGRIISSELRKMLNNPNRLFSASYDSFAKFLSAGVCLLFIAIAVLTRDLRLAAFFALVVALSYAYSPRGYVLSESEIIIKRLAGDVRIALDDVREVRIAGADDFKGCLRLFGNGGLFGYYGWFRTSKLGKCSWYVTDRANAVVLSAGKKILLLSPDDVNRFVSDVQVYSTARSRSAAAAMGAGPVKGRCAKFLAGAIGISAVLFLVGAFLYAPGPPRYSLSSEGLAIHDRFYPIALKAAEIEVENMRIVDIETDADWRPTMRTNGFANAHYRSGWFRVACGKKVRMYRARGRNLVLIPLRNGKTPVLVEVDQPQDFIRKAQQLWR